MNKRDAFLKFNIVQDIINLLLINRDALKPSFIVKIN